MPYLLGQAFCFLRRVIPCTLEAPGLKYNMPQLRWRNAEIQRDVRA